MEYRTLGRSGLRVSPMCLGTMTFGDRTDASEAGRIIGVAGDRGVNFIDTADIYAYGESERVIGKFIKRDRDHWILATKYGNAMSREMHETGLSRKWLARAIEGSLKRLGTDHVDIFYLHRDDNRTPMEECLPAVADLIRAGKARYWGFSNFRPWRIGEMIGLCERWGLPMPLVGQPYYNALNRMPEVDYLPACVHFGIGVVTYSPVARGVLTGKYQPGKQPPKDSRADLKEFRMMQTEYREGSLAVAQKIVTHAKKRGMTGGQFAINWVLNNSAVTSVIAGPRTLEQWKENLAAFDHKFTAEDEAAVEKLVPAGHPSTHGFTDPGYPVTGRMARVG
ncbi:MAG: aldo/keto reductase [Rhodospirillales bacterium]|nr:aldo/keto reductase [Rhodospirillales bacterium]